MTRRQHNHYRLRFYFSISFLSLTFTGLVLSVTAARLSPLTLSVSAVTDPEKDDTTTTITTSSTKALTESNTNTISILTSSSSPTSIMTNDTSTSTVPTNDGINDMTLLLSAINFSAQKHRDQRRKNPTQEPYINHPLRVANHLANASVSDVNVLVAAVLHDTVEDTDTTVEELRDRFGDAISSIVDEVSDDKNLPKQTRKQLQIDHAPHCSHEAKLVKLADKLDNLSDLLVSIPVSWTPQRVADYFAWAEKVISGLRGANETLEHKLDDVLAKRQIAVDIASENNGIVNNHTRTTTATSTSNFA